MKNLTVRFGALSVAIALAGGCSANHVIGAADGGGAGQGTAGLTAGGTLSGAAGTGAAGTDAAGTGVAGTGAAGTGAAGTGIAGTGASGTGVAGTGAAVTGAAGTGAAGVAGTGGTGGAASGTACGFPMPNPSSTGLPNPSSYTDNHDGTVTDNVTGLTWERTVNREGFSGLYTQAGAAKYCADKAPAGSWHLPTRLELVSLIDFTIAAPPGPTINQTFFPDTPSNRQWTSTPFAPTPGSAWEVQFSFGLTYSVQGEVNNIYYVRCVKVSQPKCHPARFQVQEGQEGGLVYDATTGLTWQRTVDPEKTAWDVAAMRCAGLGAGWRLPSITELQTIVDDTKVNPSIDGTIFPNTPPDHFWTSSNTPNTAFAVSFDFGNTGTNNKGDWPNLARCVR